MVTNQFAGADMSMSLSSGIHTMLSHKTEYAEHINDEVPQEL